MADTYTKDPQAVLDYKIDWSDWLVGSDTISVSSWTVEAGLTEDSDEHSDTEAVVWLSGGTLDTKYTCVNHIVTAAGREDDRTIYIKIKNK